MWAVAPKGKKEYEGYEGNDANVFPDITIIRCSFIHCDSTDNLFRFQQRNAKIILSPVGIVAYDL
jgi:hypothetical protein